MALTPTAPVPHLSLPLTGGGTTDDLRLGTGTDGPFSLIVFFRGLHCPVCRGQLAEIDRRLEDLAGAGVGRVVAVSMETQERSEKLVEKWDLGKLPVAHSLTEASAREWGLYISSAINEKEPDRFNEPGMFVLDAEGALVWSSVASMPFGRPPLDEVIGGLTFVKDHDYPSRGAA